MTSAMPWTDRDFICSLPVSQPVIGERDGGRQVYRLCTDMVVYVAGIGHIVAPMDFKWDGASVPRIFWRLFPARDASDPAAALHDWLYRSEMFDRALCDMIFLRFLRLTMVSGLRCRLMYAAVDKFGWIAWNRHALESVLRARALAPYQEYAPIRKELLEYNA